MADLCLVYHLRCVCEGSLGLCFHVFSAIRARLIATAVVLRCALIEGMFRSFEGCSSSNRCSSEHDK
jgi:hypothetical protein